MGAPGINLRRAQRIAGEYIAGEYISGAIIMAALEHSDDAGSFRVETVIQGIGLSFRIGSKEFARTLQCMDRKNWSVSVEGVGWRLPTNDGRRLMASRGIWNCTYVNNPEAAIRLSMTTLRQRLESRRPRLIRPWP